MYKNRNCQIVVTLSGTIIKGTINNQILTNFDIYTGRLLHPDWIDSVRLNHSYYIH